MKQLRNGLAALAVLVAGLGVAGASRAQGAESQGMALQVAHELMTVMDVGDLIRQGALANGGALDAFAKVRPEWKTLMLDSLTEVANRDAPAMEAVVGRSLAKSMTAEELTAALTVFRDPQARAVFAAYAHHQTPTGDASRPCSAECMRAMTSPGGRGFMRKMPAVFGPELQADLAAAIVPDMFITFGEKAKASEAKRAAP
jgi:hypothetical protein